MLILNNRKFSSKTSFMQNWNFSVNHKKKIFQDQKE